MISYAKLWETMKEKGISQYKLINEYQVSRGQLNRLRKNWHISTYTIDRLCAILDCEISDIVEYIPDNSDNMESDIEA